MFCKSLLTVSTAAAITAAALGATASTGVAGVKAAVDRDRGYQQARTAGHDRPRRGLRVIDRRCEKYLLKFQGTGEDYHLRAYRDCVST